MNGAGRDRGREAGGKEGEWGKSVGVHTGVERKGLTSLTGCISMYFLQKWSGRPSKLQEHIA
jgi:hypothetical protein